MIFSNNQALTHQERAPHGLPIIPDHAIREWYNIVLTLPPHENKPTLSPTTPGAGNRRARLPAGHGLAAFCRSATPAGADRGDVFLRHDQLLLLPADGD